LQQLSEPLLQEINDSIDFVIHKHQTSNPNCRYLRSINKLMTLTAKSGLTIRLTEERWQHIADQHPELVNLQPNVIQTLEDPDKILEGNDGELLAVRFLDDNKYLVTVYRELEADGFIITAYLTRRINSLNKRKELWSRYL